MCSARKNYHFLYKLTNNKSESSWVICTQIYYEVSLMKTKIFLNVTTKSTMDITAGLDYFEEKRNYEGKVTEDIYKGNIIYSITEKGENGKAKFENGKKKYLKGYMSKSTAKVVFQSILNDTFVQRFGVNGIKDYGGSDNDKGELRARIIKVYPIMNKEKTQINHYVIGIDEGKGEVSKNGRGTKIEGEADLSVETWVRYIDALKMATEILDYIRDEEIKNMIQGKPLYTIMYGKNGKPLTEAVEKPKELADKNDKREIKEGEYIIDIEGKFNGKRMTELTDKDLQYILTQTENNNHEKAKEMYKHAVKEAKRRMGKAL